MSEWTDEMTQRLRQLWREGHSTAEIGRRMAISKNSVVGRAHRLDLPARPSPIRREGATPPFVQLARVQRSAVTLAPLPSIADASGRSATEFAPPPNIIPGRPFSMASLSATPATRPIVARAPSLVAEPLPVPAASIAKDAAPASVTKKAPEPAPYLGRVIQCCWPIGEPGTRGFRWCDDPSKPGKPYCDEHAKLAYVKVRDRREDVAAYA